MSISFTSGVTKYGKDVLNEFICELQYLKGVKIIDLQNNKIIEGAGFIRPTQEPSFKSFFKKYGFPGKKHPQLGIEMKPMGFPTKIYHPITPDLPKKLPPCFELYSLPLDFFTYEDVLKVLTNNEMSDSAITNLTEEIDKIKTFESFPAIAIKIMESVNKKILKTTGVEDVILFFYSADMKKSAGSANRPLLKIKKQGIFTSEQFKHCLTLDKIENMIRNQKEISVFTTKFIPNRYYKLKLAINVYLLDKIREANQKIRQDIIAYIREGREIFPNPRKSDKSLKHLAEKSEDTIRDCEKEGIRLLVNSQSPIDISDSFLSQCSTVFLFRHNMKTGKLLEYFGDMEGLDRTRIENLKRLRKYRFYVSEAGMGLSRNPFKGMKVMYKFSDHLRGRYELDYLAEVFSKKDWFEVRPFIVALKEDHKKSTKKYMKKFLKLSKIEDMAGKLVLIGINMTDRKVMKCLYDSYREGEQGLKFTEIKNKVIIPKSTLDGCLKRLAKKDFIFHDVDLYILTEKAITFIKVNREIFKKEI